MGVGQNGSGQTGGSFAFSSILFPLPPWFPDTVAPRSRSKSRFSGRENFDLVGVKLRARHFQSRCAFSGRENLAFVGVTSLTPANQRFRAAKSSLLLRAPHAWAGRAPKLHDREGSFTCRLPAFSGRENFTLVGVNSRHLWWRCVAFLKLKRAKSAFSGCENLDFVVGLSSRECLVAVRTCGLGVFGCQKLDLVGVKALAARVPVPGRAGPQAACTLDWESLFTRGLPKLNAASFESMLRCVLVPGRAADEKLPAPAFLASPRRAMLSCPPCSSGLSRW